MTKITVSEHSQKIKKAVQESGNLFNTDQVKEHDSDFVYWERFSTGKIKARIK